MDVAGDDGQDEHEAVEEEVFVGARDQQDGQGREEDVQAGDDQAFEEWDSHLLRDRRICLMSLRLGLESSLDVGVTWARDARSFVVRSRA